jgi:hypothetical protein
MKRPMFITLGVTLILSACTDVRPPTQTTTAPTPTPTSTAPKPLPSSPTANWVANATVLSGTGLGCGWGLTAGETRTGVLWNIRRMDDSVMLDEDIPNWPTDDSPYSGSVSGTRFVATYTQPSDGVCAFRGGTLSGSFSDDGLTFEALETLAWGSSSEHQVTVQRRWSGRRFQGN